MAALGGRAGLPWLFLLSSPPPSLSSLVSSASLLLKNPRNIASRPSLRAGLQASPSRGTGSWHCSQWGGNSRPGRPGSSHMGLLHGLEGLERLR